MKSAGKARNNGLYRHIRTSKEIIRNLLNDSINSFISLRRVSYFFCPHIELINTFIFRSKCSCVIEFDIFLTSNSAISHSILFLLYAT